MKLYIKVIQQSCQCRPNHGWSGKGLDIKPLIDTHFKFDITFPRGKMKYILHAQRQYINIHDSETREKDSMSPTKVCADLTHQTHHQIWGEECCRRKTNTDLGKNVGKCVHPNNVRSNCHDQYVKRNSRIKIYDQCEADII